MNQLKVTTIITNNTNTNTQSNTNTNTNTNINNNIKDFLRSIVNNLDFANSKMIGRLRSGPDGILVWNIHDFLLQGIPSYHYHYYYYYV